MNLREVDELITLHETDPEEKEIITEGRVDACVLEWFLRSHGFDIPVYARNERLTVPDKDVIARGLPVGERGFIITASARVDQFPNAAKSITFVIDADYDYTLSSPTPIGPSLLRTDYSCTESYCFEASILGKFLTVVLRASSAIQATGVLDGIRDALTDLFVDRWILNNLETGVGVINKVTKRCKLEGPRLVVDSVKLMRESIQASDIASAKELSDDDLRSKFDELRTKMEHLDPRFSLNGQDLAAILAFFLTKRYPQLVTADRKAFKESDAVHAALIACLDSAYLEKMPMFAELLRRVGS